MTESHQCVLGVDGGGTKTTAWLAPRRSPAGEVLGKGRAGPSNPCAVGYAACFAAIEQAVQEAYDAAGMERRSAAAACLAIAGTDRDEQQKEIRRWAARYHLTERLCLANDAEPILACNPSPSGIALIAGTGSFALGRDLDQRTIKVGGWGYRIGDEGSAYAVAVAGLNAAARMADGRGASTDLLRRFLERFQCSQPREMINRIYHPDSDRRWIADLAPLVLEAASQGDSVAQSVVSSAAKQLASMVMAVDRQLNLSEDFALAMTGGLLVGTTLVREQLIKELESHGKRVRTTLVPEAAAGAVEIARQLATGP